MKIKTCVEYCQEKSSQQEAPLLFLACNFAYLKTQSEMPKREIGGYHKIFPSGRDG
jgi:hypothetical protein